LYSGGNAKKDGKIEGADQDDNEIEQKTDTLIIDPKKFQDICRLIDDIDSRTTQITAKVDTLSDTVKELRNFVHKELDASVEAQTKLMNWEFEHEVKELTKLLNNEFTDIKTGMGNIRADLASIESKKERLSDVPIPQARPDRLADKTGPTEARPDRLADKDDD
jgi:uncharacterized protein YPO0396